MHSISVGRWSSVVCSDRIACVCASTSGPANEYTTRTSAARFSACVRSSVHSFGSAKSSKSACALPAAALELSFATIARPSAQYASVTAAKPGDASGSTTASGVKTATTDQKSFGRTAHASARSPARAPKPSTTCAVRSSGKSSMPRTASTKDRHAGLRGSKVCTTSRPASSRITTSLSTSTALGTAAAAIAAAIAAGSPSPPIASTERLPDVTDMPARALCAAISFVARSCATLAASTVFTLTRLTVTLCLLSSAPTVRALPRSTLLDMRSRGAKRAGSSSRCVCRSASCASSFSFILASATEWSVVCMSGSIRESRRTVDAVGFANAGSGSPAGGSGGFCTRRPLRSSYTELMKATAAPSRQCTMASTVACVTGSPAGSTLRLAKNLSSCAQLSFLDATECPLSNECICTSLS
mmetsp:Transcript_19275/g.68102  ORF Transcript_19275/g.68102 Transcript_19275/m.68102 type:complete len:415 (+) Transcript_19275:1172-2416(+)